MGKVGFRLTGSQSRNKFSDLEKKEEVLTYFPLYYHALLFCSFGRSFEMRINRAMSPAPEEVGAASDGVVVEVFVGLLAAVVLAGVGPDQVTHGPERRRLFKPVQLVSTNHTLQKHA